VHLDVSELFITLVFQDFAEESNVVILFEVCFDAIDDGGNPFNDE